MAKQSSRAEQRQALVDKTCRDAVIDECAKAVPTTWLDPLLSGDGRVIVNSSCREIEDLLRGIQDRIRALKSD
jgi:hypothetical protein